MLKRKEQKEKQTEEQREEWTNKYCTSMALWASHSKHRCINHDIKFMTWQRAMPMGQLLKIMLDRETWPGEPELGATWAEGSSLCKPLQKEAVLVAHGSNWLPKPAKLPHCLNPAMHCRACLHTTKHCNNMLTRTYPRWVCQYHRSPQVPDLQGVLLSRGNVATDQSKCCVLHGEELASSMWRW